MESPWAIGCPLSSLARHASRDRFGQWAECRILVSRQQAARSDWRAVGIERKDFSACSVTEFRLRLDMIDLPISMFGMTEIASTVAISRSPEMRPWSIGGYYDKPIPRRIIEEAGLARGSFATAKRAATALIHVRGAELMAPASVAWVRAFAAAEGRTIDRYDALRPERITR